MPCTVSSAVKRSGVDLDHAAFSTAGAISGAGACPIASPAFIASAHAPSSFSSGPICQRKRRRSRSGGPRSAMAAAACFVLTRLVMSLVPRPLDAPHPRPTFKRHDPRQRLGRAAIEQSSCQHCRFLSRVGGRPESAALGPDATASRTWRYCRRRGCVLVGRSEPRRQTAPPGATADASRPHCRSMHAGRSL